MRPGERTLRLLLEPIARWLDDPCVTDICINRPGEVWVERLGIWHCEQVPLDFVTLDSIATLAAAMTSQDVGPDKPLCATMLPDGQRVQLCRPPAVAPGLINVTIRLPASFNPTVRRLAEGGLFTAKSGEKGARRSAGGYLWGARRVPAGGRRGEKEYFDLWRHRVRKDDAGARVDRRHSGR